jgi:uncharacterized membrane protein YebE (DUF533 family)
MAEALSESRFNMWRAVFALAHADHQICEDERTFLKQYLDVVEFSADQKGVLLEDLIDPQAPFEMFENITVPEDRGAFFQFARALIWANGDEHEQEVKIKKNLHELHIQNLNVEQLEQELKQSTIVARANRKVELSDIKDSAESLVGLGSFLRSFSDQLKDI